MSGFDEREKAHEKKYAHDSEKRFRIEARCCKLLGLWAAGKLGLAGADADTYAKEIVAANLEEAGFDDVKRKVMADFAEKKLDISEHQIDTQLEKCLNDAEQQINAQ